MKRPRITFYGAHFDDFSLPLGNEPATFVAGGSTWEEIARPGRTSLSLFLGNELVRVDVPVLLDGWPRNDAEEEVRSVGAHVRQVLDLCRGEEGKRPPNFLAKGPFPFSGSRFYMEKPDWGDGIRADRRDSDEGFLVRQALTLHLVQFVDPDKIRVHKRRHHPSSKGGASPPARVVTRQGENLLAVSKRIYGDTESARAIGKLNGIRDTRKVLKAGTKLRLPKGGKGD